MCTLALYTRLLPGLPLVVAANRDEFYGRPSTCPGLLCTEPRIVGGRDLNAGGTWLAVGEQGLLVGVLNRRTNEPPDPRRASRGALCTALAREPSAEGAARVLRSLDPGEHNPFNLLVADRERAFVGQNRPSGTFVQELEPGTHLLTNLDLNDATCPRISRSSRRFAQLAESYAARPGRAALVSGLHGILADHLTAVDDRQPTDQLCIHTELYGTRSSSIVWLDDRGRTSFLHAPGPPCRRSYRRVALPWAEQAVPPRT
jgi:uncharacterized protein with NRDE domain